jgi:Anaerobic ribonucleoside-triphosphate reductase
MAVSYFFVAKAKKEFIMPHRSSVSEKIITTDSVATERKVIVEVYSRVVGYYRPVNQWNIGKQEEFAQRKEYSLSSVHTAIETASDSTTAV